MSSEILVQSSAVLEQQKFSETVWTTQVPGKGPKVEMNSHLPNPAE